LDLTEIHKELLNIKDPIGESIARQVIPQIKQLVELGLGYLSLSRKMSTLSSGVAQRVKIARHLGSSLNNITYIIDQTSAGLHPKKIDKLILIERNLQASHNTVVDIEYHISIIKIADEIIEMRPSTGVHEGKVVYQGTLAGLNSAQTATNLKHRPKIN